MESLSQLFSRDALLPIGVCLAVFGILLRGFARSNRRSAALREQHWLHNRKVGEIDPSLSRISWLERNLNAVANGIVIVGASIAVLSFFL